MTENTQTKKGGNRLIIVVLVLVVLILIGAVAFLLLGGAAVGGLLGGGGGVPEDKFIVSMDQLVLRPNDMDAVYNYAPGGDMRMDNAQFSKNTGSSYAKPYISSTGRVDGWDVAMERADTNAFAPEFVRTRVEYYADSGGASDALSEEWFWAYQLADRTPDEFLDENCKLGKDCISFKYSEAKAGSGNITERYDVAFRYENVVIYVSIKGVQGEVTENLALEYGQMVLDKVTALN